MKKVYTVIPILIIIAVVSFIGFSQKPANDTSYNKEVIDANRDIIKVSSVIAQKKLTSKFDQISLFSKAVNYRGKSYSEYVNDASFLSLNKSTQSDLLTGTKENITLQIPYLNNTTIEVELTKVKVTENNFKLFGLSGNTKTQMSYVPGVHYRGIIKGKTNSIASLSVFNENVMGVFSDENGNYVLGSLKNDQGNYTDDYVLYNDLDLKIKNKFKCSIDANEDKYAKTVTQVKDQINDYHNKNLSAVGDTIKVYFEADNDMYTTFNSNVNTTANFIAGLFNSVATIYQNEGIPTTISGVAAWTGTDPYASMTDSYEILISFGARSQDNFSGNLAHLLSTGHGGQLGGIAWIRTLCTAYNASDSSGRYAFSNIDPDYSNFPTYSWTVNVVAHEMGHSVGSYHTHACHWPINGQIRGIDTCVITEENDPCALTARARSGTIMSYCHLNGEINLASGFGPLPGDTIRAAFNTAGCLNVTNSSERPLVYDLIQNFPNPFNPATTIKFNLPAQARVSLKVYDLSGKEVASLFDRSDFASGTYNYYFNTQVYNLSSGVYFYKMIAEGSNNTFTDVKKMILVK